MKEINQQKIEFRKKYNHIKLFRYVPLLEKQVKIDQRKRKEAEKLMKKWWDACFDYKRIIDKLKKENKYLIYLIILLVIGFGFNLTIFILWSIA
jgi:hypothetical protein